MILQSNHVPPRWALNKGRRRGGYVVLKTIKADLSHDHASGRCYVLSRTVDQNKDGTTHLPVLLENSSSNHPKAERDLACASYYLSLGA